MQVNYQLKLIQTGFHQFKMTTSTLNQRQNHHHQFHQRLWSQVNLYLTGLKVLIMTDKWCQYLWRVSQFQHCHPNQLWLVFHPGHPNNWPGDKDTRIIIIKIVVISKYGFIGVYITITMQAYYNNVIIMSIPRPHPQQGSGNPSKGHWNMYFVHYFVHSARAPACTYKFTVSIGSRGGNSILPLYYLCSERRLAPLMLYITL